MKPEIGKWYKIKYGKEGSKRGFHGSAKCLGYDKYQEAWFFRDHKTPEELCQYAYMLFKSKEIICETESLLAYDDLVNEITRLQEIIRNKNSDSYFI